MREIENALNRLGMPTAVSIPGYILPRDTTGRLQLNYNSGVASIFVDPPGALAITPESAKNYKVTPAGTAWGRVRVTVTYKDRKTQTIHYYVTKSAREANSDLGNFLSTEQWFNDESDPFGRGLSPMGYTYDIKFIISQEQMVWVAGLSEEGGAGSYVSAFMKQVFLPNIDELRKLESFVNEVLFKTIQDSEYGVRKVGFLLRTSPGARVQLQYRN